MFTTLGFWVEKRFYFEVEAQMDHSYNFLSSKRKMLTTGTEEEQFVPGEGTPHTTTPNLCCLFPPSDEGQLLTSVISFLHFPPLYLLMDGKPSCSSLNKAFLPEQQLWPTSHCQPICRMLCSSSTTLLAQEHWAPICSAICLLPHTVNTTTKTRAAKNSPASATWVWASLSLLIHSKIIP